jgi:transcription elongation factor Elf1
MNKEKMDRQKKWFLVQPWNDKNINCPECGEPTVRYEFIGNLETRMGYCLLWCNSCLVGINISRTKVPEGEQMLSFEQVEKGQGIEKRNIRIIS